MYVYKYVYKYVYIYVYIYRFSNMDLFIVEIDNIVL